LWDTDTLAPGFFDIEIEYAKNKPDDIFIRATATNHGPNSAALHILPTLWFRNTWSWGRDQRRPNLRAGRNAAGDLAVIEASHDSLGEYRLYCDGKGDLLFTENESNAERLWSAPNRSEFVKDAFHDFVVCGETSAANPARRGTKAAA